MKINTLVTPVAIAVLAVSLAACSTPTTPTSPVTPSSTQTEPNHPVKVPVVEPVVRNLDDLDGETIALEVGQVLDINTGTEPVDAFTGDVENPDVAEYIPGKEDTTETTNPGVKGLEEGSTKVILTNTQDGSEPIMFTITVE